MTLATAVRACVSPTLLLRVEILGFLPDVLASSKSVKGFRYLLGLVGWRE